MTRRDIIDAMLAGMVVAWAIDSLRQDALGLEGYVAYVRAHWAPASITVPVAIVFLVVSLTYMILLARRADVSKGGRS